MSSLDTNIVLRLLLQDVPDQLHKVMLLLDQAKPGSLMIADIVFFECVWVLSGNIYGFNRELIGRLVLQVADIPQISCNRVLLEKTVPLYVRFPNISFADACLVSLAELKGAAPLLTFDRKLASVLPNTATVL